MATMMKSLTRDGGTPADGAKSAHWASPAAIEEAKYFTFIPTVWGHGHICNAWSVPCARSGNESVQHANDAVRDGHWHHGDPMP